MFCISKAVRQQFWIIVIKGANSYLRLGSSHLVAMAASVSLWRRSFCSACIYRNYENVVRRFAWFYCESTHNLTLTLLWQAMRFFYRFPKDLCTKVMFIKYSCIENIKLNFNWIKRMKPWLNSILNYSIYSKFMYI